MKNILDLRKKTIKVITKTVFKPRSFKIEVLKVFIIILISTFTTWGVSWANNFFTGDYENARDNFSIMGTVSEIDGSKIVLENITNTTLDEDEDTVNIDHLEVIQTGEYVQLVITDIELGEQVIVQGVTDEIELFAKRIISMSDTESEFEITEIATSTATTTASTTDESATSTGSTTDESTEETEENDAAGGGGDDESDEGLVYQVVDTFQRMADGVMQTFQVVLNTLTGQTSTTTVESVIDETATSTATSTDETVTSTATSTDETATSTATTTDETATSTATSTDEISDETEESATSTEDLPEETASSTEETVNESADEPVEEREAPVEEEPVEELEAPVEEEPVPAETETEIQNENQ